MVVTMLAHGAVQADTEGAARLKKLNGRLKRWGAGLVLNDVDNNGHCQFDSISNQVCPPSSPPCVERRMRSLASGHKEIRRLVLRSGAPQAWRLALRGAAGQRSKNATREA